jgi:hypothetical protein
MTPGALAAAPVGRIVPATHPWNDDTGRLGGFEAAP